MARLCNTCNHPERSRIEQEAAIESGRRSGSLVRVAERYGLSKDSLYNHMRLHIDQATVARLRHGIPDELEVDIDELTRKGGQDAVLGFKRLAIELREIAERCEKAGDMQNAIRARAEEAKCLREMAKMAAMYPGLKSETTNNNLVIADERQLFALVDGVLKRSATIADARRALSAELQRRALGHDVVDAEVVHVEG